ncbi:MAG: hypothetical protein IJZ45_01895 [Bacteroidaceae bacterium]|nr:hypothetical protein [Bacteroidaceae bacterium]
MRRYLFFALLLCLQWTAWGQATYDYRYWFDTDDGNQRTGSFAADSWHIDADLSGLDCSLHTIHIQVKDTAGVWSAPVTRHFIKISEESALSPYYWFNNDYAGRRSLPALSGVFDIDVSELSGALNTFHYQVSDTEGSASAPLTSYFLKVSATQSMTYRYWLDNDTSTMKRGEYTGETLMLDVSKIQDGIHIFHLQMEATGGASTPFTSLFMKVPDMKNMTYRYWVDNDHTTMKSGRYVGEPLMVDVSDMEDGFHIIYFQVEGTGGASIPANRMFIKIPQTENIGEMTCVCTIDGKLYKQEKVPSSGGLVDWTLDVSTLFQGLHRIQVQVLTPSGAASNVYDSFFFRTTMQDELKDMTLVYSVDGEAYQSQSGDFNTGMFHFDVDVASLEDGLHRLTYMLTSETGTTTKVSTAFFVKTPLGGPGIASYKYWLNDYEDEARFVKLAERKNPYELISLLPVDECSIRSTCFHFEVEEDGTPMVYAKNDIHLQFFDVSNRVAEAHKQYVDYNVGEAIEEITLLESGKRVYKAKPQDNKIHWFKVEAVKGDSLSLKTDQACTIQIFSPSGKEVYNQSGSGTVSYNGIHAQEDGTFYIALHDVTGTKGNTIALDFQHIDKYDVLRWDVSTVGNGGCSTITFEGNGFKDLYAVDLYNNNGDTIDSKAIHYESDATVTVTFDFTDKNTGKYNAVFHFTTEDRTFANILSVEEAKNIDLDLKVEYPRTFLRGTSVTYTIAVTNNGNATAYDVPLELKLHPNSTFSEIESVVFTDTEGNEFSDFTLDGLDTDSIDEETLAFIKEEIETFYGLHNFIIIKDSVKNQEYGFTDINLTIAPKETSVFYVTLKSNSTVTLEVRIPSEWITVNTRDNNGIRRNSSQSGFCCYKEATECLIEVVVNMVGFLPVSGCIGLIDHYTYTTIEIACSEEHSLGDKAADFFGSMSENAEKYKSYKDRGISAIWGCVLGRLIEKYVDPIVKKLKVLKKELEGFNIQLKNTKKSKDLNLIAIKNASEKKKYYNQKTYEYEQEAARRLNSGDKTGAKEMYVAAENARKEAQKQSDLILFYEEKISSADDLIESINKQINEIQDKIKLQRMEEIAAKDKIKDILENIKTGIDAYVGATECRKIWDETVPNCPPNLKKGGGSSSPVNSYDPNDIYGYRSESGSKAVKKDWTDVYYTIEFENDTAFATASAQDVYLTDTLDSRYFDLKSFAPTSLKIGDKKVELSGEPNFVTTVDMRPKINAIAQVECQYDEQRGIVKWHFTSLDPMTMEHVTVPMDGFLPVNNSEGDGQGEVSFNVRLKTGLADGEQIPNRASIVFDLNEAIMTPTWINVVDTIAPQSAVVETAMKNDTIMTISFDGTDNYSGVWKYDLYVQAGVGSSWFKLAENLTDSLYDYRVYDGIDYGFCVIATDSAGNVEQKELIREWPPLDYLPGDANGDGCISVVDLTMVTNAILRKEDEGFNAKAADLNMDGQISITDATMITNLILKK